jgi:hypothetical protein
MTDLDAKREEQALVESIYPVKCDCGWSGMSDDCSRMRCPNCGERVTEEYDDYRSNEDMESFKRGGRDIPRNSHVHPVFRGILNNVGRGRV